MIDGRQASERHTRPSLRENPCQRIHSSATYPVIGRRIDGPTAEAYDYQVAKLKLFGLDGDVSDRTYEKMAEGLVEISFIKKPYPPKSAIFDGRFVQQAAN
jgi:hypothetical protein